LKAAFFTGDREVEVRDIPKPKPGIGEVLIQMKASGICGSDVNPAFTPYQRPCADLTEQDKTIVRGHEPCGIVAELGPSARNVKVGDRVIVHHYFGCGKCKYCLAGWRQMCIESVARGHNLTMGIHVDGGHEEFMVCMDSSAVPLPDGMSFEEGACCACGTGTAYQAMKRLAPSGMDTLAVFGQGQVGASVTLLAKAMGARIIAVDTVGERLELAEQLGADETVNASQVDPVEAIKDLTGGEGAEATIDCTGKEAARVNVLKSTRPWGRACFVGEGGTATFEMTPQIVHRQLTIYGSWTFSTHVLAEAAKFIVDHGVPLKNMIKYRFPLEKAAEAYHTFEAGAPGKVVIIFG